MKKKQSGRLTKQHRNSGGVVGIFGEEAQYHDKEVYTTSLVVLNVLEEEYPSLQFRYRKRPRIGTIMKKNQIQSSSCSSRTALFVCSESDTSLMNYNTYEKRKIVK